MPRESQPRVVWTVAISSPGATLGMFRRSPNIWPNWKLSLPGPPSMTVIALLSSA